MKRKLFLKNRRRFYTFISIFVVAILTSFFTCSAYGYKEPGYKVITVNKGDTLWNIAKQYNKSGDIRKYIFEIKRINKLTDSEIFEGKDLKIPNS